LESTFTLKSRLITPTTSGIPYLLADQLRQSSDDLTRMARTYVVTGDARYRKYYQEILDIRDGRKPRPDRYFYAYWDLVLADAQTPQVSNGPAILRSLT
jgi:methyl-accepting chemotaxis protein